jgi:hypothetical protein
MGKPSQNSYRVMIFLFSFWFMILPAFLYFSTLDASDINPVSSVENIDEADSTPNFDKSKIAGSTYLKNQMFLNKLLQ